jgi:hypothetical protein
MRFGAGLVGTVTAIKSGIVIDEHGRKHTINAGTTRWDRASPELNDPVIAAYFGLSIASDGFPRSRAVLPAPRPLSSDRPSWYLK